MSGSAAFVPSSARVNATKAFSDAFGAETPDGSIITDPLGALTEEPGFDTRPAIKKSLEDEYRAIDEYMEDGGSFRGAMTEVALAKGLNVGDYTLPIYPQADLTRLSTRSTPFLDMIPVIARNSNSIEQDSVTGLATPQIGGERDVPEDQDDDYEPKTLSMTYFRIKGSVSGPMNLASSGFRNSMAVEQQNKAEAMKYFAANLALNGNPTQGNTSGGLQDSRGFKGIRQILIDSEDGRTREPEAGVGTSLTTEDVRNNFSKTVSEGGNANSTVHVTDLQSLTDLKNDLDDHDPVVIQGGPTGSVNIGARGVMVDGTPVVASDFMPQSGYDVDNNTVGRNLLTLDMRFLSFNDLSSTVMELLAKTEDADEFFMKRYTTLMHAAGATKYGTLLTGLP